VLSIQAAVVTAAEVDHRKEASVTVPTDNLPYTLTGANAVLTGSNANQGRAVVNANLRKSEEIEGDHEDSPFAVGGPYQARLVYYYPNINTVYSDLGISTIGPSVEYPSVVGCYSVNLKLKRMIITYFDSGFWNPTSFNGFVVTSVTNGADLPQPAYFISSTINTSLMTLTSTSTTITLNWQGASFTVRDKIVIGW